MQPLGPLLTNGQFIVISSGMVASWQLRERERRHLYHMLWLFDRSLLGIVSCWSCAGWCCCCCCCCYKQQSHERSQACSTSMHSCIYVGRGWHC